MTLTWPGDGWRLVRDAEARALHAEALYGAVGPSTCRGFVVVREVRTLKPDLAAAAAARLQGLVGAGPRRLLWEDLVQYSSRPAWRQVGVIEGGAGGDVRYQVSTLSNHGLTYEVVALAGGVDTNARACLDRFTACFEVWLDP
jgi:hypothetical protein